MDSLSIAESKAWGHRATGDCERARFHWNSDPVWGVWQIPEKQLSLVGEVDGLDVVELGCGSAYISSWLARRGANVVAVDYSVGQLKLAEQMQNEHGIFFRLLCSDVRSMPLPDSGFDLAISEYGACTWCHPSAWLCEASRILRVGGRLIFIVNSVLMMLCLDVEGGGLCQELQCDYYEQRIFAFGDSPLVEHHSSCGEWIRQLRSHGFVVEDLIEITPPPEAVNCRGDISAAWAKKWPAESIWLARKVA